MKKMILAATLLASASAFAAKSKFESIDPKRLMVCQGASSDSTEQAPLASFSVYSSTPLDENGKENMIYMITDGQSQDGAYLTGKVLAGIDTGDKAAALISREFPNQIPSADLKAFFAQPSNLPFSVVRGETQLNSEDGKTATLKLITINGLSAKAEDGTSTEYSVSVVGTVAMGDDGKKVIQLVDVFNGTCKAAPKSAAQKLATF